MGAQSLSGHERDNTRRQGTHQITTLLPNDNLNSTWERYICQARVVYEEWKIAVFCSETRHYGRISLLPSCGILRRFGPNLPTI
ncbi:uncharacterized protein ARMOST_18431 [Armillaria ostoyae]|uniref:Uncharacterized protein n=1 Tax=Armillaria ostoyae TaxID=47428 RepID=A0A284S1S9_ARMOS|nr:uncharacterized protein ARMOST_18431 [Armillaria ostoyae]